MGSKRNVLIRRGRDASLHHPDLLKIMTSACGAAICGLYAIGQRELFANQIMEALLGEHWSLGDFFAMVVAPLVSICLVPLAGIVGAAIGIFVVRLFFRTIPRTS